MRHVQLRAFHHVALTGGFSRAAQLLGLTQPAISDQVRKLETEYDVRLFDRSHKQVTLTRSGEALFDVTRRLFEIENQALELLAQSRSVKSGRLNIIADSAHHVTEILSAFRRQHPAVFVSVSTGNSELVLDKLNTYEADIGVLGEAPDGRGYDIIELGSTPIIAFTAAGSAFGKCKSISLEDLAKLPLVMREKGSKTRAKFEELANRAGIELRVEIEAEGREAVREIVANGDGVGIVSEAEFGSDSRLVKITIPDAGLTMDEALICLRERQDSRVIRLFMQLARMMSSAAPDGGSSVLSSL